MNEQNTDVEGRLAVGGPATLLNFGTASAHASDNGGKGTANALVSNTSLTYTNGTIHGDLHYNDNAVNLTSVAVTGTTFANSTPIDFGVASTSLIDQSQFLATQAATGTATLSGTTLTLTGSPTNSLNVFTISSSELAAATFGRLNITNVAPTATVLINVSGTTVSTQYMDFQYNGVGGDQPFAHQVLYNLYQATSLTVNGASPLGSILAPTAAVTGGTSGGHISGTLIAGSLSGMLEGHEFLFQGNLPSPTPQQADLALTKTVNDETPNVGDTVTFTVTLTNYGPDPATSVSVADALPAGLTLVSATPSQGSYAGGVWTVGTVSPSTPQTLTLAARVVSPNEEINTATISHSDQFDPVPGNNSAAATVTPQQADLVVGKRVSDPTPNVGETITYTVTVANDGPNAATGVALRDVLPAAVSFQSFSASAGSFDPATRTWTVGTVAVGTTQTLTITARVVSPNPATNTASISHADQFDPDTSNNSDTASIVPQQADLELTKFVSDPRPNVGDTITYTVTLINNGPATATGVEVTDQLPSGLTFESATPSQGSYDSSTGVWSVGTVAKAAAPTLTLSAHVVSPSAEINTATISHSDQFDPDPGNNNASSTVTPQQADLALTKTVSNPKPSVGDIVTFTVGLNNHGPDTATSVTVADALPAGLTLLSATPSQGSYADGIWTVGTVSPSTPQTLTLAARVVSPNEEINTATISHSDQFDPDQQHRSATVVVTPSSAPVTVISLKRFGFHKEPTLIVVGFSGPLDASSAQDLSNYSLILIAHAGRLRRPVSLAKATYDPTADTVSLQPKKLLPLRFHYSLTINASTPTGVRDTSGRLLDGAGNGIPGSNFVRVFGREILAGKNPQIVRRAVDFPRKGSEKPFISKRWQ